MIIGSILALLASLAAIIVAVRVSRSLVDRALMTRLARLRNDSLDLARNRLPNIVERLKNGESVDLAEELPQLDHGRDEIGQVAEAFNTAQLTAVNAAASEAKARSGVHNVFLGIAHRNQVLVHQQLQILDEMEAREDNSTQLASLFQLDHLAARARRTTENLIILGGKQPGRRWRKPVPLMEVLRAAVSETEQYARVQVEQVADVAILGAAVADTIHLVAELVDNATSFSPPGSPVEVTSRLVARGVVVDVSDQGLGMKDGVRELGQLDDGRGARVRRDGPAGRLQPRPLRGRAPGGEARHDRHLRPVPVRRPARHRAHPHPPPGRPAGDLRSRNPDPPRRRPPRSSPRWAAPRRRQQKARSVPWTRPARSPARSR